MPFHLQVLDPLYLLLKSYETEALRSGLEMAKISACTWWVVLMEKEGVGSVSIKVFMEHLLRASTNVLNCMASLLGFLLDLLHAE